jgi:hypothetical protein
MSITSERIDRIRKTRRRLSLLHSLLVWLGGVGVGFIYGIYPDNQSIYHHLAYLMMLLSIFGMRAVDQALEMAIDNLCEEYRRQALNADEE